MELFKTQEGYVNLGESYEELIDKIFIKIEDIVGEFVDVDVDEFIPYWKSLDRGYELTTFGLSEIYYPEAKFEFISELSEILQISKQELLGLDYLSLRKL